MAVPCASGYLLVRVLPVLFIGLLAVDEKALK